jgi:fructose-1,6-bisphosphatase-3
MILEEFGLNPKTSHILNGHVPVKIKDGESPVRAGGRRIVIDGGISKAYQKTTGIAGYTFIFNSWTMALAEHKPYEPMREDGTQTFHTPKITTVETLPRRMMVRDSDQGRDLEQQVEDLKELVAAYRSGKLKEVF